MQFALTNRSGEPDLRVSLTGTAEPPTPSLHSSVQPGSIADASRTGNLNPTNDVDVVGRRLPAVVATRQHFSGSPRTSVSFTIARPLESGLLTASQES